MSKKDFYIVFMLSLRKILNMKMLMAPILTFLILINNQGKSEARMASLMGTLKTIKNGVSGDIHSTDNEMVLEIKNFKYDGKYIFNFKIKSYLGSH